MISMVNTEGRRDRLLADFVESAIHRPNDDLEINYVIEAIDRMRSDEIQSRAIVKCVARLTRFTEVSANTTKRILPILDRIERISHAGMRCNAYCLALDILSKTEEKSYKDYEEHILNRLAKTWRSIDPGYARVDIGFNIVESLSSRSINLALAYLDDTNSFRNEIYIDSYETAIAYKVCLELVVRALGGLIKASVEDEEHIEEFSHLLDELDSCGHRAVLWAELAQFYYFAGRSEECKAIVTGKIKPLLSKLSEEDNGFRSQIIVAVAPSLYVAHQLSAIEIIEDLNPQHRDEAFATICKFILYKCSPSDPYEIAPSTRIDISYEEIIDMCAILDYIETDHIIYGYIREISSNAYRGRHNFSRVQLNDIARRLKDLSESKFPNPRFINHPGYKILGLAQASRLNPSIKPSWNELVDQALAIDNISDRAFILCNIASTMPSKKIADQRHLLKDSVSLIDGIPCGYERAYRYEMLASTAMEIDSSLAREYLKSAMKSAVEGKDPGLSRNQKRLIDHAYRLDPELASSMVSLVDNDRMNDQLSKRVEVLDLKESIRNKTGLDSGDRKASDIDYSELSWSLLGSLNAGRIAPIEFKYMKPFIVAASDLPLIEAYLIYSWAIENLVRRWSTGTRQAGLLLRPIFEAFVSGAKLSLSVGTRSSEEIQRSKRHFIHVSSKDSIVIRAGDRDKAMDFITNWFKQYGGEYLKICDPYFGLSELDMIQVFLEAKSNVSVQILTSREHHKRVEEPWERAYTEFWRLHVSSEKPPDIDIAIVGIEKSGKLPIHDRWIFTAGSGLRLGTSLKDIGITRDSEISTLTEEEIEERELEVDQYFDYRRRKREHNGKRLLYRMFTM